MEAPSKRRSAPWLERSFAWLTVRGNEDIVVAVLLAVAALATAWSSYQASIWSGVQAVQYNVSSGLRTRAMRAAEDAARFRMVDIALFTRWLEAYVDKRTTVAAFYETHFRPEFRPAFVAWRAADPKLIDAPTPLDRAEYRVARSLDAERLDDAATRAFEAGQHANDTSDGYVFGTVILASVLFFAGAVRTITSPRGRVGVLLIAMSLCVWALVRLATSPVNLG